MRIAEDVRTYLEGIDYPASPQDLLVAAQGTEAPSEFVGLLGLLPTAIEFFSPEEIADQLERMKDLLVW